MKTYFIDDEKTCLIDTSAEENPQTLIQGLKTLGKSLLDIDFILITHVHLEHIRSLAYLKKHIPNCQILTSPRNADYLANYEKYTRVVFRKFPGEFKDIPGLFDYYYNLFSPVKSVQVDAEIKEGDTLSLGNLTLEVLETPGHCAEEISFYCKENKVLFSGDFIVGNDRETWIAINPIMHDYGGNRKKYLTSLSKIAQLEEKIDLILPAHGSIITNPKEKIEDLLTLTPKAHNKVLKLLETRGPKTLPELVELYSGRQLKKTMKFYHLSRLMRALLNYLLEEDQIIQQEDRYFLHK